MKLITENNIWQGLRLSISFLLLWAFLDKIFGLGLSTPSNKSWLLGTSPTTGFLKFSPHGIFAQFFNGLSGNYFIDILFMSGLLLVGLCLLLGIGMKIASYGGAILMLLIYLSLFPPENNPVIDEHIFYILILIGLSLRVKKQKFGFGEKWSKLNIVKKYPTLE